MGFINCGNVLNTVKIFSWLNAIRPQTIWLDRNMMFKFTGKTKCVSS